MYVRRSRSSKRVRSKEDGVYSSTTSALYAHDDPGAVASRAMQNVISYRMITESKIGLLRGG